VNPKISFSAGFQ